MQEKGFERASRWADRIQLFAFIVVLLIVSTAVWLASYFLIQPFVQDNLLQMLIATSVSLALAGLILVWRRRLFSGTLLLFISAGIIALSLALFWQSLQGSVLCLHGFLLASIAILNSLRNREGITDESFKRIGWVLGPVIILTGPLGVALELLTVSSAYSFILAGFTFTLAVYVIGLQYLQKYSRLGVPNVIIISIAPSMLTVDFLNSLAILSPVLLVSGFLIAFGMMLFVASQCAKRLQSWAGTRWVRKSQKKKKGKASLFEEIGLGEVVEDDSEPPLIPDEWIIVPENANTLSGISLILVATGVPSVFVWLSESTIWGTELQLVKPIALIIGLLVLAPSPVLFRLGERLTRDSEYMAVRAIGVAIVILASASGFLWTQFYLWPILVSLTISVVLFVAGMTGLFREVRKIWRRIWLLIVGRLRDLKSWVLSNMLVTGIIADLTLCIILFSFIDPIFQTQQGYPISILSVLTAVFTGVGIVGLSFFRSHPRRLTLLSIGLMLFLSSLASVTFWHFYYIVLTDAVNSIAYSLLWFLGSIALFKLGFSRFNIGFAYSPGVLAAVYLAWMFEAPLQSNRFPILTLLLIATLPGPILNIEYRKVGRVLLHEARRLVAVLHGALIHIGRILLKFILISWALFSVIIAILLVYYLLPFFFLHSLPAVPITLSFILIWICIWFPALQLRRSENLRLYSAVLIILCAAISLDLVVLLQISDLILNILAAATLFSVLFTISVPVLIFVEQRARSAAFAISAILLLGLYLAPFDLISKIFLAVFSIGLIAASVLSKANRVLIAYPVVTGAFLAFVFWHFYLYTLDARFAVVGYVAVESMLLSVSDQLRNKATWTVFAVSTGLALALVLSPLMNINLVLASLVALEILRFTPSFKLGEKTGVLLGVARTMLVGASVYLLIISWIPLSSPLRQPLMEFGISSLTATAILAFSMRSFISSKSLIGLQSIAIFNLCIVIFFYLWAIAGIDIPYSTYIAGIPFLAFTGVISTGDTFKRPSWLMFCIVVTAMVSSIWFTYYRSTESLWLCITTAIFLLSSLRLTDPKGHEDIAGITNTAIGTLIFMLESIWVWHCFLVFLFDMNVILAGVGLLLTPVILMPLRNAISWDAFRILWGAVSATIAVSLGSLISNWNLYDLILPTEPYLASGIILSLFSSLSTPTYLWIENRLRINEDHLTARYSWGPSLVGWATLGIQIGAYLLGEIRFILAMAGLGFALALFVFYFLTPARPRTLFVTNIIILASAIAGGVWVWAEPNLGPAELIALFLFVWYILSLPLTLAATITFLGWLATKGQQLAAAFSRFISWVHAGLAYALMRAKDIYSRNKARFAALLPILMGALVSLWIYDPLDTSTILGLPYKNLAFAITFGLALVGLFYWFEAVALEPSIGDELRSPSMILFGFGVNNTILLISLTAASYGFLELIFVLSLATSLALITVLAQASSFSLRVWMRRIAGILGIALFVTTYGGLITISSFLPLQAITFAVIILLVIEVPVFWVQVKAFARLLGRYGAIIVRTIRNIGSLLFRIFRSFGYVMWTFFALLFVVLIAVLSRPLFSELLNMTANGLLYEVPSLSIPTTIIGLLMLFIAIVRRRVRTRFGLLSGLYAAFGGGVTAIVFLFDHGYQALSLFSAIIAVCGTGLMLKGELQLDPRHITMLWLPIPPSISLSLLYYMLPSSGSTDSFLLAMLISFSPTFLLYLLSTTVNWISKRHREMLWSILAAMTGTITYFGSYLLIVPPFNQVAGIYLGVFVASIIMYPVTARSARQLFLSPLFFSLTGFAYTIVLGPVYRSLLLAAAAFLLFVSRYIKEKETMNPRLVYFRLVVLVALVACIATFAIATGLEIISTL